MKHFLFKNKYWTVTLSLFSAMILSLLVFSCQSIKGPSAEISRELLGTPVMSEQGLFDYFMSKKPDADRSMVKRLAHYYVTEGKIEGINSDVAFAQMCLETGYLSFGNLVVPEMHNYCGLGAMDAAHPGEYFESEQIGVRAHIQHLQAYATTQDVPLKQKLVDPRYGWVHKVKFAKDIYDLAGVWATDKAYGEKIDAILSKMEMFR